MVKVFEIKEIHKNGWDNVMACQDHNINNDNGILAKNNGVVLAKCMNEAERTMVTTFPAHRDNGLSIDEQASS